MEKCCWSCRYVDWHGHEWHQAIFSKMLGSFMYYCSNLVDFVNNVSGMLLFEQCYTVKKYYQNFFIEIKVVVK